MTVRSALPAALAAGLIAPSAATAQDPAPAPPPAPVEHKLALTPERVGPGKAVPAGTRFRVRGVLTPAVAGEQVTVRFYRGARRISRRTVTLLPSATGRSSYFVLGFRSRVPGRVRIEATKVPSAALPAVKAAPRGVRILPLRVRAGSRGAAVRELQRMLRAKGYVVGRRGLFDARTARAVLTFRKVTGMARTSEAGPEVFRRLARGGGTFRVRFPRHGRHIEADISRQVVALIGAGGKVERIYPTSTGAPATPTILGSFRVYRKDPGTNALGMVASSYFIRGYAIHGYHSVPTYNASHGCLRVPVPDARSIYGWVRMGTRVDTYR